MSYPDFWAVTDDPGYRTPIAYYTPYPLMCDSAFQLRHFAVVHKAVNIEQLCHFLVKI
jgi:hypothetical protein